MSSIVSASSKNPIVRAGLGLAAVAAVGGTLGGFGLNSAQAADTDPFGTLNLMQGQDIGSVKDNVGELNSEQVDLYGARTVTACTGSARFDSITGDQHLTTLGARWTNSDGQSDDVVTEAIAQARTKSEAKSSALKVLTALKQCQSAPKGQWHYSKVYHGPLRNGDHVWLDRIDGHGKVVGGVAVMLQGTRFGVVEISQAIGDGDDAIKNTVLPAEDRLAS